MSELALEDLDRDELLELIRASGVVRCSQADLWRARWRAAGPKARAAADRALEAEHAWGAAVQRHVAFARSSAPRAYNRLVKLTQAADEARKVAREADECARTAEDEAWDRLQGTYLDTGKRRGSASISAATAAPNPSPGP